MSPESKSPSSEDVVAPLISDGDFSALLEDWKACMRATIAHDGPWALVGVKRRGSILARRIWREFSSDFPDLAFGEVDVSLYRDDYHLQLSQPRLLGTEIEFNVDACRILLIDDVLYTGRTIRAALDLILDFGRPRAVQLAVLVDRGHRELPIASDFTGRVIETDVDDRVRVRVQEMDGEDSVNLIKS